MSIFQPSLNMSSHFLVNIYHLHHNPYATRCQKVSEADKVWSKLEDVRIRSDIHLVECIKIRWNVCLPEGVHSCMWVFVRTGWEVITCVIKEYPAGISKNHMLPEIETQQGACSEYELNDARQPVESFINEMMGSSATYMIATEPRESGHSWWKKKNL